LVLIHSSPKKKALHCKTTFSAESEGLASLVCAALRLEPFGSHPLISKKKGLALQDHFFSGE
jgi:hypothetical protein